MPSRNIIKQYAENGFYHIYNRGVEKRDIFKNKKDCIVFQRFLKQYLSPKSSLPEFVREQERLSRLLRTNMSDKIQLLAFALMPNHFHLFIRQTESYAIATFMKRFFTSYVKYFNKKHERIGSLFQDTYKAVLVDNDEYLLHLSRYIHLNPNILSEKLSINYKEFNSYPYYLGEQEALWVHPEFVLDLFPGKDIRDKRVAYHTFVSSTFKQSFLSEKVLKELLLA